MVNLVDTDQPLRQLKHVIAQRDDDELCVLGALFDVGGYDGYLFAVHTGVISKKAPLQNLLPHSTGGWMGRIG